MTRSNEQSELSLESNFCKFQCNKYGTIVGELNQMQSNTVQFLVSNARESIQIVGTVDGKGSLVLSRAFLFAASLLSL